MRVTIIILMVMACTACEQNKKRISEQVPKDIPCLDSLTVDTSVIAIIPFDTTDNWPFENAEPTNLNQTELQQIEKILADCIAKYNPKQKLRFDEISAKYPSEEFELGEFIIELNRYKRQYVPVINEKGEKVVWVNCFCGVWDKSDKYQILIIFDGGNCYFNVKINLATEMYYDFMVNGWA